ncbi:hypothetical protein Neosp_000239 [[Neocosmospora] mangrovei]
MHSPATLPNEIIVEISSYLSLGDRVKFSRTCQRINGLIEPRIWADIELHGDGFHESRDEIKHPPPFKPSSDRFYLGRYYGRGICPLDILQGLLKTDRDRLKKVASRVKSFCSVIEAEDKIWDLLPYFVNLEALELHGRWDESEQITYEIRSPPLAKLRFAKLLGYIPQAGARWILRSGPTLERLELGMLDWPTRATEWSDAGESDRDFASLSEENLDEDDENRVQAFPRPLSGFLPEEGVSLPILQHLYLCSPAHRKHTDDAQNEGWPTEAEEDSSEDWRSILKASHWTLQTLVLEHKVTILNSEAEARGEEECMRDLHTNNDGGGSSKLAEVLETAGVYRVEWFPELTHVYFYGIVLGGL